MSPKADDHFEGELLSSKPDFPSAFKGVITNNDRMKDVVQYLGVVSRSSRSILITGERATGKYELAKCIHHHSNTDQQISMIDTVHMDEENLCELLCENMNRLQGVGDDKKHFSSDKTIGTIYIDEISETSPSCQLKLLSFLKQKERVLPGPDDRSSCDVRLIVSSSKPLKKQVIAHHFNEDLYYRLKCHHVHLPSLAQRKDDLELLLKHYLQTGATSLGITAPDFEPEIIKVLEAYDFPGNLRELEAIVFNNLCCAGNNGRLGKEGFVKEIEQCRINNHNTPNSEGSPFLEDLELNKQLPTIDHCIDVLIEKTLEQNDRNQTASAKSLGITRQGLLARIKRKKKLMI